MMFGYDRIINFFKTNFAMMQHHKYSLVELEQMMPWERFVYVDLLKEHIKVLDQQRRDQAAVNARRK